jgi:acetylornithine deacetylase/succinyl-diaminopimelate desuccinylase-like protein
MLRAAGFTQVTKVPTDGQPGIFGVLDAGAAETLGLYFMYDVKQVDPAEWSSPPFEAALSRQARVWQSGSRPRSRQSERTGSNVSGGAARHPQCGKKLPVNLVFVAEGEEEIGSPHFRQVVHKPEVLTALKRCSGVFMPFSSQDPSGEVVINLGAKGVVELELVATGERWGRGPKADIHSSNKARVDSPAWHLVKALNTLVADDGNTPPLRTSPTRSVRCQKPRRR